MDALPLSPATGRAECRRRVALSGARALEHCQASTSRRLDHWTLEDTAERDQTTALDRATTCNMQAKKAKQKAKARPENVVAILDKHGGFYPGISYTYRLAMDELPQLHQVNLEIRNREKETVDQTTQTFGRGLPSQDSIEASVIIHLIASPSPHRSMLRL